MNPVVCGAAPSPRGEAASREPARVVVFDLDRRDLASLLAVADPRPFRVAQLLRWVYVKGASDAAVMTDMPADLRGALSRLLELRPLEELRVTAAQDGTRKFLLGLPGGGSVECVLIPEEGHHTLCLSTQSGCAMGCAFCATGRLGAGRDLTRSEILAQVALAIRTLGSRNLLRNLVFMGMGEPLLNLDALLPALGAILDPERFDFSPRRVTVSTCGWVPGIDRLAAAGLGVNLAVSLNAADDSTRGLLMPINRSYPLQDLMAAVRRYPLRSRQRVTFEYVLVDGVNDSPQDASRLAGLLAGIPSKVNLIACNPNAAGLRPSTEDRVLRFQEELLSRRLVATVRRSRGGEIGAACGQLAALAGEG